MGVIAVMQLAVVRTAQNDKATGIKLCDSAIPLYDSQGTT